MDRSHTSTAVPASLYTAGAISVSSCTVDRNALAMLFAAVKEIPSGRS